MIVFHIEVPYPKPLPQSQVGRGLSGFLRVQVALYEIVLVQNCGIQLQPTHLLHHLCHFLSAITLTQDGN